jgi:tRNA modification GTPase
VFSPDDTIVAIATPPGRGGIGVVRIGGPEAARVAAALIDRAAPLRPRHATFAKLADRDGPPHAGFLSLPHGEARRGGPSGPPVGDEVVVTWFAAPHSYTGQDIVEISAHGSPVVLEAIVRGAMAAGARLAQPGEFTLRAFLSGKRDLVQAEAVADLIAAATPLQARTAFDQLEGTLTRRIVAIDAPLFDLIAKLEASLDFPDEGYHFVDPSTLVASIERTITAIDELLGDSRRGRLIREGATVVVAGRTNVGKSSLFNCLAGSDRAIVTEIAGTTRDLVTERVALEGLSVTLVDTAGDRDAVDMVEREGVSRGVRARDVADLVLLVVDGSASLTDDDVRLLDETSSLPRLVVANKCDRGRDAHVGALWVSALTGEGMPALRAAIARALTGSDSLRDTAAISNTRHIALLEDARELLRRARVAAASGDTPEEFLLTDLQAARACFDEVVGARTTDDLLTHIFERFCIGK